MTKIVPVVNSVARRSTASLNRWARAWKRRLKRETESGPDTCPEGAREGTQDAQGTFVMILELTGSDHTDGDGCPLGSIAVAGPGATIGAMSHGA